MKQTKFFFILVGLVLISFQTKAQNFYDSTKISPSLIRQLKKDTSALHDVRIFLTEQVDVRNLDAFFYQKKASFQERTTTLVQSLQSKANATQPAILIALQNSEEARRVRRYWIVNAIYAELSPNLIVELSRRSDVRYIELNGALKLDEFTVEIQNQQEKLSFFPNGKEPGLVSINAPAMWALGYTGFGTKAMSIDTGVDPTHPALKNAYEGLYSSDANAWFDPNGFATPYDCDDHGTHTVGTMVGLDRANNDTIGVAFDATWLASPAICGFGTSDNMAAFQWALNPDGNLNTTADMPTVICNSWYDPSVAGLECGSMYQSMFDVLEAAGVAVVFSAGNEGPGVSTITPPKNINNDLVSVFCVGALSSNTSIANFSSQGPSICGDTGSLLIKPEVSAPGVNVRSSVRNGSYANLSGTSMAAPHASGAVLLLKQAFPYLTGREIKLALYFSAIDLGVVGEDDTYGMGLIDVHAAYQYLINQGNVPVSPFSNRDLVSLKLENVDDVMCVPNVTITPQHTVLNNGLDTVYNVVFRYTLSNGVTGTVNWSGVLLPKDTLTVTYPSLVLNSGFYELSVTPESINGQSDERPINNFLIKNFVLTDADPVVSTGDTACFQSEALLHATHPSNGQIRWYNYQNAGTEIAVGNSFVTPSLASSKTYFVDVINATAVGLSDKTVGNAQLYNGLDGFLRFDAYTPFTLKSVTVFTNQAGGRAIQLVDKYGNVVAQKFFTISAAELTAGKKVISLNWRVPKGEDFQLQGDIQTGYFINTNGFSYPIELPTIMSIKSGFPSNAYAFFYDWQIEYGNPCGRMPVTATVQNGTHQTQFTQSTDTLALNISGTIQFTDNSNGATAWFWDFGDGNSSTQPNPTHTYATAGVYKVYLTTQNSTGCGDASESTVTVLDFPVATTPLSNASFSLFPNPTDGKLILEISEASNLKISLFNSVGKLVLSLDNQVVMNKKVELNLHDLPTGIYFLQMETKAGKTTQKVYKQ